MIAGLSASAQVTTFNPYGVQKYATGDSLRLVGSQSGQYLTLPTTKMVRSVIYNNSILNKKYSDSLSGKRDVPGQGLWLMSSFKNNDNRLYIQLSNNGKTWKPLDAGSSYTAPSGNEVRDPSILYFNNLYYVTHSGGFFGGATYAPVVRSGNLQDWDLLLNVNTNTTVSGVPSVATWAPEWFVDTAGKKLPALIYTTNPGNSTHTPFYSQALDVDLLNWSSPTRITGTSMPNMIDLQIIYKGGFYYLWYKNETTKYIEIMRSTSPYSGYTSYKTGNWAGFGPNVEGVSVEMVQPGIWRVYMDAYGAGTGIEYFDSIDDWNSWIPFGSIQSTILSRHGTVRYTSSLNVLRNAVNYYVSKDIVTLQTAVDNGNEVYSVSDRSINLRRAASNLANGLTWATGINSTFFLGQREIDNDFHLYNFGSNADAFKIGFNTNSFSLMSLMGSGSRPVVATADGTLIDGSSTIATKNDLNSKLNTNNPTATGTFTTPNLRVTNFNGGVLYSDAPGNVNNVAVLPVSLGGTGVTGSTGTGSNFVLSNAPTLLNPQVGTQAANDNSVKAASTAYVDRGFFANDITVNGLTVGRGSGNVSTNTAFGSSVLTSNTGSQNTGVGFGALASNLAGISNVALGFQALYLNTSGSQNVGIGYQALSGNTTGNNNTAIGQSANVSTSGLSNATAIGYNAVVDASNKVQIGNSSVTALGISQTIITGANAAKTLALPSTSGTLALISDLAGKANISGGNSFTGVQNFTNGSVQPLSGFSDSGFINTLSAGTLTTNVSTFLPTDGGQLVNDTYTGKKQVVTASGNGSATTISISHGMTGITSSSWVSAIANNAASSGIQYVTVDASNVNIFYTVAPVSGTNNLLYSIEVKK